MHEAFVGNTYTSYECPKSTTRCYGGASQRSSSRCLLNNNFTTPPPYRYHPTRFPGVRPSKLEGAGNYHQYVILVSRGNCEASGFSTCSAVRDESDLAEAIATSTMTAKKQIQRQCRRIF